MADENDGIKEKENQRSKRKPGKAAALFQKKEKKPRWPMQAKAALF